MNQNCLMNPLKMRHSGTRPYRCPFCEYSSIQASTFKNHVSNRHANDAAAASAADGTRSVYGCRDCNFKTVNRETYYGHLGNRHRQQQSGGVAEKDKVISGPHTYDVRNIL